MDETTIRSVDLVLARYKESVDWVGQMQQQDPLFRTIVYTKGPSPAQLVGLDRARTEAIQLPNLGLEAHTYMRHIVDNYDRLADKTVFTQAQIPSPGFFGHTGGGGHLLPKADFVRDYLAPTVGGICIPTVATDVELTHIAFRRALVDPWHGGAESLETPWTHMPPVCPATGTDAWLGFGPFHWSTGYLYALHSSQPDQAPTFKAFWERYLLKELGPPPDTIMFASGGIFSATKEQILAHPKSFYEALLAASSNARNSMTAYYLELVYGYMFGFGSMMDKCVPDLPVNPWLAAQV